MNMKATLWLWSILTTILCTSQNIYGSPLTEYRYSNSKDLRDNYIAPKRTKPSLSIVNPLDVLRQRLLLEIARRQMTENAKQVHANRQILKNVGKRGNELEYYDFDGSHNPKNAISNLNLLQNDNEIGMNTIDDENNNNNLENLSNNNLNSNILMNQAAAAAVEAANSIDDDNDYQIKYIYSLHPNNYPHKK